MAEPVVVEQEFDASVDELWRAITERDQMVHWYFAELTAFEPVVGFQTEFALKVEDRDIMHRWEVTDVAPGQMVRLTWRFKDIPGDGAVTWELAERGTGSSLRLTNTGLETFPQGDPLFTRESCEGGWRYFINERLKSFLDG